MGDTKRRRLFDLQIEQEARRSASERYTSTELDEIRAIKFLAFRLWGDRGLVEINPTEPGVFYLGQYEFPFRPDVPKQKQRRRLILRGRSHADLERQARLLLA